VTRVLVLVPVLVCAACAVATAPTRRPPVVTGFAFTPPAFSVPDAAPARRATTIRFRLSGRAAGVTIRLARRRTGRGPVPAGAIVRRKLGPGRVALAFGGRVGRRTLIPGRYRATIVATDHRGLRSRPRRATFRVVRAATSPTGFPNASNTGVPDGWTPQHTTNGDLTITTPGRVLDGELVTGDLLVRARDVTIRNSWIRGSIDNQQFSGGVGVNHGGLLIEDTDVGPPSGTGGASFPAVLVAGYTARRVHVHNVAEGFRVADFNDSGAPVQDRQVVIEDSYVHLERGDCSHNDGIQGFGEPPRTIIRHNTIDARASGPDCTTAALFIGNDNPDRITVTNNLLAGGGFTLRLGPGGTYDRVSGNRIVDDSWGFGAVHVENCAAVDDWSGNAVVTVDSAYRITSTVRRLDTCR
jgi:hypothetical protein